MMLGVQTGTSESLGQGFLLVFNSNCRPPMHHLATIHEYDRPKTTDQPMIS